MFKKWLAPSDIVEFIRPSVHAASHFRLVLKADDCKAVMVCFPGYDSGQEIVTFASVASLLEHGLWPELHPHKSMCDLRRIRERTLKGRPYIYINYFGVKRAWRGQGYGRAILQYIIRVADEQRLELVLEAYTEQEQEHFAKFGFQVVHQLPGEPRFALMVRGMNYNRSS